MTAEKFITGIVLASLVAMTIHDCKAADWDNIDKGLFGAQIGLQVVDTLQTNYAKKHPEQFEEANPIYGKRPNMLVVIGAKSLFVGGLYWIVKDMPSTDRKLILGVADAIELAVVGHNISLGVKVGF